MTKYTFTFLIGCSLLFTACDNEIDLTAEYENIPIVYGLLDAQDTAHYIRVEKAFLSETTSAIEVAGRPDSLYYDDADVTLVDLNTDQSYNLTLVDGNEEGYVRDSGLFATDPNYLYKISEDDINLRFGRSYRFELFRGDTAEVVTSETTILDSIDMFEPERGERLSFTPDLITDFRWFPLDDAAFYSLSLIIHYRERGPSTNGEFVGKELEWTLDDRTEQAEVEIDGRQFYSFLANSLESNPDINRDFGSFTLKLDAGGQALEEYVQVLLANTGITGAQEIPNFSNLSEGYGVFSSITRKRIPGLGLTGDSRDTLQNGSMTADLNF